MIRMKNKIGFMLISWLAVSFLVGCEEEYDPMEFGIVDMNHKITSVDKEVTEPGDIVTFTGTDLDKVYKIMLNEETVPVVFEATATELKMTVPSMAPLGDVVTISLFFSGNGLAQRTIRIISPPVIFMLSPSAAQPGETVRVLGRELYLAEQVKIGGVDVTATFTLIDDKQFTVVVPEGFTGGDVEIITATGKVSTSPSPLILGTEILINDFDGNENYFNGISSNGNMDGDKLESEPFPRLNYWTFTITDNGTGWGGNVDFYISGLPSGYDNDKITLYLDLKLSSAMNVNVMVQGNANVYGLTRGYQAGWQTVEMHFSDMGTGYGGGEPYGEVEPFEALTAVKVQPPAQAGDGNFGETVSVDNIRFIIAN